MLLSMIELVGFCSALHAIQIRAEQHRKQIELELEAASAKELERRKKAIAEGRG